MKIHFNKNIKPMNQYNQVSERFKLYQ